METVLLRLDRGRFPWVGEDRTPEEKERYAAAIATASLIAVRRVETKRRNEAKDIQEEAVKAALRGGGFTEAPTRDISTPDKAPKVGEFCGEEIVPTVVELSPPVLQPRPLPVGA